MKIQQVALVVLVALVGSAASKSWYGWYGPFEHCHDSCPDMCSGTDTCTGGDAPTSPAAPASTGVTGAADFTTVPAGYTPAPGECVCVSEGPSTAGGLVPTGAASTAAPGGGVSGPPSDVITCPCQLVNYLWNLTFVLEGTVYYDIYVDWLIEIQITILADQSLSEQEKFFACIFSLQSLFVEYVEIELLLQYQYLGGFGYVCDLFTVIIELQVELSITETLILIEGGSCAIFEAFWNCSWTSEQYSALTVLFEQIRVEILEITYLSYIDKCILIYQKFYAFFEAHAEWDISIFYNITIQGFGCFGQWYQMCGAYFQLYTLDFAIGGSFEECALMKALDACGHNSSYDLGTRQQFQELYGVLLAQCGAVTDVFVRLELVANITWEYYLQTGWDLTLFWSISWSYEAYGITCEEDFYEFLWLAFFYYRYGFSCSLPLTTSAAPITEAATTTEAPTTLSPCDVSHQETCFTAVQSNDNHSCPFIQGMWNGYKSSAWDGSCKNALFSIINRCNTYQNAGGSWQVIANKILTYLGTGARGPTNNAGYQQQLMSCSIQIEGRVWGRLCDMAACVNTTYSQNAALQCAS